MSSQIDLIIRNGTIVDGTGIEPYVADIAIAGDTIVAIGDVGATATEEIDARDMLVTPGFVDIHTHYDGQAIWESRLSPSSGHGVTTILMGNCGVGFAPCRAEDRDRLVQLMEGVEDIPGVVMTEGLTWEWESYPQYLDAVAARPHDINLASYLPHSALRVYVMRDRAIVGETATSEDLAQMAELTREAMAAGALGFSSSRSIFHRSSAGEAVPTLDAGEEELLTIARAMQDAGDGILQIASDYKNFTDLEGEFGLIKRVARETDRLLTLPMAQSHSSPDGWRDLMALIEQANAEGMRVTGQVLPRGIGMLFGLDLSLHPFTLVPSYQAIQHLPLAERLERMRDPELRARIIAEGPSDPAMPLAAYTRKFEGMFEIGDPLDYEPSLSNSIASRAAKLSISPQELAYDLLVEREGRVALFLPFANYADGNLDVALELFRHKDVVLGLGDGGAHYGVICDASYSTFLLSHWTRDRTRGERLTVPEVVKALSSETADMVGLADRGRIAIGYKADINIIDHSRLTLHAPKVAYDLPAGGRRLSQQADGFIATIVNGQPVYRDGKATGALPGKLIRGRQASPTDAEQEAVHA